jgi:3-oxoacyl-[acyl-carrier-protein] synthase-3
MTPEPDHTHAPVGIAAWGTYLPERCETAADIARAAGIPESVVVDKLGVRKKHVAGPDDHCAAMAARAGRVALERAGVAPDDVDLVLYHGSEYKDFVVWSAATKVQALLACRSAAAFELYALCAGTPLALKTARALMRDDPALRRVLLVTASRENDLVDYENPRARFMFGFGAGGGALLLERGRRQNQVVGAAALSDGSLSETVVMPAGGSRRPPSADSVSAGLHRLDVLDLDGMAERLGAVSLPSFRIAIERAVAQCGATLADVRFLGLVHMKRSFHDALLRELGLGAEQSVYLEDYGHVQSVDQVLALEEASRRGLLKNGDLVVLAGAGTGYTWSAAAVRWGCSH